MSADIERLRFGIVKEDRYILCGKKTYARFKLFRDVTARDEIVLYESEKKARAALENSWYLDRIMSGGDVEIVPFKETLEVWCV